ncbi:hypothetical protein Rhopal_001438-T1 [Rhodotorula paludigena]|uniref:Uncharacterized protein n=1 Tax=Rhodotorula paludigena TaxID=86838 RepID=A0AAV5GGF4_9BASI|nr:hypothetical protein Rhopal_001438-T1 [Rhodotorula paludigena]
MASFAGFESQAQSSQNQTLSTLLNRADSLSRAFGSHHASSFQSVQVIQSAWAQLQNLQAMPATPITRNRPEGGIRERGIVKIQSTVEEALAGVRDDLGKMEGDVEQLNALLFDADLFLAQPQSALQHGLNPKEALTHVSGLFAQYQAELIRLREVLADFTSEEIGVDQLVDEWRTMKEVDKGQEAELSDLVDVLGAWGASGGLDVDMS